MEVATCTVLMGKGELVSRWPRSRADARGVGRTGNEARESRWAQRRRAFPARLGHDSNMVGSHGGFKAGPATARAWALQRALWQLGDNSVIGWGGLRPDGQAMRRQVSWSRREMMMASAGR